MADRSIMKNAAGALLLFMAFAVVSCGDDKKTTDPERELSAVPDILLFEFGGGKMTFSITAVNVEWDLKSDDDWIEYEVGGESGNDITVTLGVYEGAEQRTGKITVYAVDSDKVPDVVVNVKQDVDADKSFIWKNNSRFFAKLLGKVSHIDYAGDYSRDASFDEEGYVVSYKVSTYGSNNQPSTEEFVCEYTLDKRIKRLSSSNIDVGFVYGTHNKYIEVAQDIFYYNNMSDIYLFQPKFLKGLESIEITMWGASAVFDFTLQGDEMTVTQRIQGGGSEVWSNWMFDGRFPSRCITEYSHYSADQNGDKHYFDAVVTENFVFDAVTAKIITITETEYITYREEGIEPEQTVIVYNYYQDTYNNISDFGSVVYTYDEYGDYDRITSRNGFDQYSYVRDKEGNWTKRTDDAEFLGLDFQYVDNRKVSYYESGSVE